VKVAWIMTVDTYEKYLDYIDRISFLNPEYDCEEYGRLIEEFQMLPGFPKNFRRDADIVVPVLPANTPPLITLNIPN